MFSFLASVVLFFVAPAAEDSDIELYEYTVKKGDTCAGIAKRKFGNRKAYGRIHKHNPGMGPTPHKLVPGTILMLPRAKLKPDARVTASERRVEARAPSETGWKAASQGFELFRGWRLSTLERAFAEVTFRDSSRIYMRENTLVIIYGGTQGSARRSSTTAKLDRGALRASLSGLSGGKDKSLKVETPSANAEFKGGSSLITVDEEGTSRVANHGGGKAKVRSGKRGKAVSVPERMGSKIRKGKAPTAPKPLPETPLWAADNTSTFVIPAGATGSISGEWGAVDKAESYRIEVGRQAQGGFVMSSVEVPKSTNRFEVHGLPAGEYFATIAAVDADKFESPPSRLYKTKVVAAPLTAPTGDNVDVPPAEPGKPLAPVRVLPGAQLDVPAGLVCGLGESEPSTEVIATGEGVQQVRCRDAGGKAVGGFAIDVVAVKVAKAGEDGAATALAVRRGETTALDLAISADTELPTQLAINAPAGFEVGKLRQTGAGNWVMDVTAGAEAETPVTFDLVIDGTEVELAEFQVTVIEPEVDATPEPEPEDEPDRHMFEAGVYGGIIAMSTNHELLTTESPLARDRRIVPVSPNVGVRFGYYPVRVFGFELEGGLMPTELREGSSVLLFEGRASLIGQLPGRITPYVLLGGGVTGLTSDADVLGDDADASFHWGGGVKFFATRYLAVRLGVRDVVLSRSDNGGASHSPQVLLGISGVFRRTSAGKKRRR